MNAYFKANVAALILAILTLPNPVLAQKNFVLSYKELQAYQGLYHYSNGGTLQMAASPKDTVLYAIINQSKYPLKAKEQDVFVAGDNDPVRFLRDAGGRIRAYTSGKDTFNLIDRNVNFPVQMWYPKVVSDPQDYVYRYHPPEQLKDGLPTGDIAGTGLDQSLLASMMHGIVAGDYPNVHSILLIKNGKLVFEEYFYEYTRDTVHEERSASKSFISALTGIAINKGLIKSVNEKALSFFPEYQFQNPSELKQRITVQDLLDNQSGVNYDASDNKSVGNEGDMDNSADWVKYTFDLPMADTPGTHGRYNSGNPITLGRIVEKTSGTSVHDFAAKNLFGPLGINHFRWNFKPDQSSSENFCQVYLRPRDMAKFGLMYLQGGSWNGRQVVPAAWVTESTSKHSVVQGVDYGYLWWLKYMDADGGVRYNGFAAQGNGGQRIFVFPGQQLVVVLTGGNYNSQSPADGLIKKYILPSFNGKSANAGVELQKLRSDFISSVRSFGFPDLQLSYVQNLGAVKSARELEKQLEFFKDFNQSLSRVNLESLAARDRTDYEQMRFETKLNLERLALEIPFRLKQVAGVDSRGLHYLPEGKAWYRYFLKKWLGDEVSPDDVFQAGLKEIGRVEGKIEDIRRQTGMTEADFYRHLNDSSFFTADEREIVRAFQRVKRDVNAGLPRLFYRYAVPDVQIRRGVDKQVAQTPGYRDNTFFYNLFDNPFNKRQTGWLFMHEAIPGHHFQRSVRNGLHLSELQSMFYYPGFAEGWAAYIEEYGKELGAYKSPYDELGKWEWDIVRSVRVPLDIGINYYGWSEAEALEFWKKHVKNQDGIAMREINRIKNWPCQVITYKYGAGKFLAWKRSLEIAQGAKFDVRFFHDQILKRPALPFFLIERELFSLTRSSRT